jgi:hypothetical protein
MTNAEAKRNLKTVEEILQRVERSDTLPESERKSLQTDVGNAISRLRKVIRFVAGTAVLAVLILGADQLRADMKLKNYKRILAFNGSGPD